MKYHRLIWTGLALFACSSPHAEEKLTVFAAASLTNALSEISSQYEKETLVKVVQSYAASSSLARQIENGAPADIFISADTKWMDYLAEKKRIDVSSRSELLRNKLVLIAPRHQGFKVDFKPAFDFTNVFDGKLCTGELASVPAGIYAKQALSSLGWWSRIKSRIVGAQDVRSALAFVERGECAAGIVYGTDARATGNVEMVGEFPAWSHQPVVYPIALVAGGNQEGKRFLAYLKGPQGSAVFSRYGFTPFAQ